jgi:type II secretory pathway component PulF
VDAVKYSRRLAMCVTVGVPAAEAAAVLAREEPEDPVIRDLAVRSAAGAPLAGALRRYPDIFPAYFTALIESGESGGWLDDALGSAAKELERTADMDRRLCLGGRLPAKQRRLMHLAAVARYCARLATLVDGGIPLLEALTLTAASVIDPSVRRGLLAAHQAVDAGGSLARSHEPLQPPFLWRALCLGSLTSTFAAIVREVGGCYDAELNLRLTHPRKSAERRITAAVFARKFAALFRCGVPLVTILELLAEEFPESSAARKALTRPSADRGYRLTELLAATGLFERWQLDLIDTAERAGRLDEAFMDLAGILNRPDEPTSSGTVRKLALLSRWAIVPGHAVYSVFGATGQTLSRLLAGRELSALDAALLDAGQVAGEQAAALAVVDQLHTLEEELPASADADDCRFLAGWAAGMRLGMGIGETLGLLEEDHPRRAKVAQAIRHAIGEDPQRLTLKRLLRSGIAPWMAAGIAAGAASGFLVEALDRIVECERFRLRRRRPPLLHRGAFRRRAALAHTSRVLGVLMGLTVPFEDALDAAASASCDRAAEKAFRRVRRAVAGGASFARAVGDDPAFPPLFAAWIGWGEAAGALDAHLVKIADLYETELADGRCIDG